MSDTDEINAEALVKLQHDRYMTLKRVLTNFRKDASNRKSKPYFIHRLQTIETLAEEFKSAHQSLVCADHKGIENYFTKNRYEEFDALYLETFCAMHEQRDSLFPPVPVVSDAASGSVPSTNRIHLPKLPVPTFSGKFTDWASFYDGFKKLVHTNTDLNAVQKFHFLKQALPSESDLDIQQMPLTEINYGTAFDLIIKRYNNPRLLFMHQMNTLHGLPALYRERAEDIKAMLNVANVSINSFKQLNIPIERCDHWIAHLLLSRLPRETHQAWELSLGSQDTIPTFPDLEKFLYTRLVTLDALENRNFTNPVSLKSNREAKLSHNTSSGRANKRVSKTFHMQPKVNMSKCALCGESHILRRCPKFLAYDCFARKRVTENHKLCHNCLSPSHTVDQCPSTKNCSQCGRRHHSLLHFSTGSSTNLTHSDATTQPDNTRHVNLTRPNFPLHEPLSHHLERTDRLRTSSSILLATALVNVVDPHCNESVVLRALIDQGSECTLITEFAAQRLQLTRRHTATQIHSIGQGTNRCKGVVSLTVQSRTNPEFQLFIEPVYVLNSLTTLIPSTPIRPHDWPHLRKLALADPTFHTPSKIDLILGADIFSEIMLPETRIGTPLEPIGQHTRLGWILSGRTEPLTSNSHNAHCLHVTTGLDTLVRSFFDSEQVPEESLTTNEDQWCEEFFKRTHVRQPNGKYLVRLPLKSHFDVTQVLGKSKQTTLNRFHQLERKLNRNLPLRAQYTEAINDYFLLQQIVPANSTEEQRYKPLNVPKPTATSCVLPHHAVLKQDAINTKLRVVFDASAQTSNGFSLNDVLCTGPSLQNDLSAVILNWRLHRHVFIADIQKMYRCIDMNADDSNYQRILWRNPAGEVKEFCLTTVTFGTASAPYTAIRVLHQLADDERQRYPLAEHPLKKEIYVDDVLTGSYSVQQALKIRDQLISALRSAGMDLRKWASNTPSLLHGISPDHQSNIDCCQLPSHDTIKTLGIAWQPHADSFTFRYKAVVPTRATKRNVLSIIARLFDPLGLMAPVVVTAKLLLKTIWTTRITYANHTKGLEWDDPLPEFLQNPWTTFMQHLPDINGIQIPRWLQYDPSNIETIELHAFSDGSTKAYAATVYIRIVNNSGQIHASLLTAKTRITPKNPLTIPRIELCGAVLATDLVQWVKRHFKAYTSDVPIHYWTDATIILYWIRGEPHKLKPFVANRISKLLERSTIDQWHYVNTSENPADCATRGLTPSKLAKFNLWWFGPPWLCHPENTWPANPILHPPDKEESELKSYNIQVSSPHEPDILHRYSSFTKLVRITAWMLRFADNTRTKDSSQRKLGALSVADANLSLQRLIRLAQRQAFHDDLIQVSAKRALPEKSKLRNLNPFLDDHNVLRVGGRLKHSTLSFQRKHPIILPSAHHFSDLIIDHSHFVTLHGGAQLTLTHLRQRYWILRGRQTVQNRVRRCLKCFRNRPRVTQQLMGNLPFHRINQPQRPFLATGVDYTGAIELKASRYRGHTLYKGYIAIFICLATKAIHLEAVTGLSTEHFLLALQRFIGRRGVCHDIYSDCGTNFLGAAKVLHQAHEKFLKGVEQEIIPYLTSQEITWHFNPPYSPNFGGLWEANVKAVKYHLKRVVGGTPMTYEILSTVLVRIEACLNSRPLCPLTSDPEDYDALTPAHFLIGDSMLAPPNPPEATGILRQQHHNQQQLLRQFWDRWSSDWLSHLQTRPKWQTSLPNLRKDELVLLKDDRLPPNQWILGRIAETHPGSDGLVRVISVRTKHGISKRSVSKICRLPIPTVTE